MKKRLLLALSVTALLLTACGSNSAYESDYSYAAKASEESYFDNSYSENYAVAEEYTEDSNYDMAEYDDAVGNYGKKLVHDYNINIQAVDFDEAKKTIDKKINECNGYVENSSINNYDTSSHLSMTIRIPQERAIEFLSDAAESGNVTYQSESTTDKTLEYVDVDSRMKSYKQELEVMEDLAKRAETVDELLQIENNIADLRGQIDSFQSQLNSIDNRVSYATIYLELTEVETYSYSKPSFWLNIVTGLSDSLERSGEMIGDFIIGIPVFITGLILFLIPFSIVVFLIVKIVKFCIKSGVIKSKKKKNVSDVAANAENKVIQDEKTDN